MSILIQRFLYNTINTELPDHFAGQHCANIGRKFSDLSLHPQKEIFFFHLCFKPLREVESCFKIVYFFLYTLYNKKVSPTFCTVSGKNYIVVSTSNNILKFEHLKISVFGYRCS